jgi:hypothetical protein
MKTLTDKLLSVFDKHKDTIQLRNLNGGGIVGTKFFNSFQFDKKSYHFEICASRKVDNNEDLTIFFPGKQEFIIIEWETRSRYSGYHVYNFHERFNKHGLDEEKLLQIKEHMFSLIPSWGELIKQREETLKEILRNGW